MTCDAGTDVAGSVRTGMKTASNVFVPQILQQILERAAHRAWSQQDNMGAVSLAVGFLAKAFDAARKDPTSTNTWDTVHDCGLCRDDVYSCCC